MLNWSLVFFDRVLEQVVFVDFVNLARSGRVEDVVLEGISEGQLIDDQPGKDEKAEVLDPG